MSSGQILLLLVAKDLKICTELTFLLTHHYAAITSTSREQGEQEGESRDIHPRLTLASGSSILHEI